MKSHLPNEKLPCKWHGCDNGCVRKDSFYNPKGPRACFEEDMGIVYIFSGRSKCTIREEMRDKGESFPEGDDGSYYFCSDADLTRPGLTTSEEQQ
jgi:hypothetical protein